MPKLGKVIGIVGSRRRDGLEDLIACENAFANLYQPGDSLVSGGCRQGGDKFADIIARTWGLTIVTHYPRIREHDSPECFFVRNTLIAEDCDVLIAVVAPDRTGGTEDAVRKALALGKTVVYV